MIDPKASEPQKLKQARNLFEAAVDHYDRIRREWHRVQRFYDNTRNQGQWDADDLDYLRNQSRPAFTFNLIKPKVDTAVGMFMDAKRKAQVAPVGGEDAFVAEVLNDLIDRVRDHGEADGVDADVMKGGMIKGEKNGHLHVEYDPEDPSQIRVQFTAVSPHDIHWDPGSQRADRSDALYVFFDRWMSKGEFSKEYPEHADDFDTYVRRLSGQEPYETSHEVDPPEEGDFFKNEDGYEDAGGTETYYYDRHRNKVRVVHCEYLVPAKRCYVIDDATGTATPLESQKEADFIRRRQDEYGDFAGMTVREVWKDETYVVEFIGGKVLYESDGVEDRPFDGFSVVPFTCFLDGEDGVAYGMVRNLLDVQQEVNKSWSSNIDAIVGQSKTGWVAEDDAIEDVDAFEDQVQESGSVAITKKGALTSGAVRERKTPEPSSAAQVRLQNSVEMVDRISAIHTDMEAPASQAEAAATVQIRYHKSQLSLAEIRKNYERYQQAIVRKVAQIIVRAMPDAQIAALLGNNEKYAVQGGVVYELGPGPDGQPVVKDQAELVKLRTLKYDATLETTTENTTLRMLELQQLAQLAGQGVPVDPVLLVEKSTSNRAERERLKEFAEQAKEAQAMGAKRAEEQTQAQLEAMIRTEMAKVMEAQRHNQAEEALKAMSHEDEHSRKVMEIWEKADAAEKSFILETLRVVEQGRSAGLH